MSASMSLARAAPLPYYGASSPGRSPAEQYGQTVEASASYHGDVDALHGRLVKLFEESEYTSYDARHEAERARDYYDGKQWTAEEVAILRRRRQPVVVNNYVKRKIDLLRGVERRGRSDPKAFPRTPDKENRSDAATQALRYIADDQRYDVVRSSIADNIMIEGYGGCEVIAEADQRGGGYNVVINHIPWDRLFYDPHSRHPAFTDSTHQGIVIWQDYDDALAMWPGCEDILEATLTWSGTGDTYRDKPDQLWCDARRRRVMTVQHHWKEGRDWYVGTYTRGGFVEQPQKSPYPDRHGNAASSLIMRSCYVDRDGNRYGLVKDLVSPQDAINKRESKILHALSVNQVIMEFGAFDDIDKVRVEAAKPDGVIAYQPGMKFEIHRDDGAITGQFELLKHSVEQMNVSGPNASMAGKDPREQSGRAIIAQQSGGMLEFEAVADAIRQHTRKVYEAAWMRVKQFWTEPKWIRISGDDKLAKFVGLNNPITLADKLGKMDPAQAQQIALRLGLQPNDPRLQMVVGVENELSDIDCDIDIEEGPDSPTMQAEQFVQIMQLPKEILANFPPAFFIQASSLRDKEKLIAMIQEHQKAQAQSPAQQLQVAGATAAVAKTQAEVKHIGAQTVDIMHNVAVDHASHPLNQVEQLHGMAMDHHATMQPPDNALAAPPAPPPVDPLAAQAQDHDQMMERAKLGLAADQQAHSQAMDVAGHELAVAQAMQPPTPPATGGS